MEMLCDCDICVASYAGGVQATRNLHYQQRRQFAKSALHHAGRESCLQLENKAATTR